MDPIICGDKDINDKSPGRSFYQLKLAVNKVYDENVGTLFCILFEVTILRVLNYQ